jgi:hypothetical protein
MYSVPGGHVPLLTADETHPVKRHLADYSMKVNDAFGIQLAGPPIIRARRPTSIILRVKKEPL